MRHSRLARKYATYHFDGRLRDDDADFFSHQYGRLVC